jgi:hypothetical protein
VITFTVPPAVTQQAHDVEPVRFFACIVAIEGHDWSDYGGALAFQPQTWAEVTALPFRMAKAAPHAINVGTLLLAKYQHHLERAGIAWTPESAATAWRWGLTGAIRRRGRSEYGQRAANLYRSL